MVGLVKLMGIVMVALGAIYLVKPATMKKYIHFWLKGKRIYFGGILNLLIGIIFLAAASQCILSWFVTILGILSLIKGILIFAFGLKKITAMAEGLTKRSVKILRIFAFIALVAGIVLIYSA